MRVKEMIVKMFQRMRDIPPGFLYRFRCGINRNHCLLPMERARESDDDTRDRMLFAAADDQRGEFSILTIVSPNDAHWWYIEHMVTNSEAQGAILVRDILLPVANSHGIHQIYVEAYHDNERELRFWQNIGFRGAAYHKRKGGDRIRMEWTQRQRNKSHYGSRVRSALPPKRE